MRDLTEKENKTVYNWLLVVCVLIIMMVVFGGLVRLTRSGLSIVEWNPISGVIPPIGQQAWEEEFAKYQQTPEYKIVNHTMTLFEYKEIFYLEYFHRLIARFAGLIVVIPLFYFIAKGMIPWRKSAVYLLIGALFGFQGFLGWYMVSSGLVDRPAVSHFRLTFHLLTALALLALTFWMLLHHRYRFPARLPGLAKSGTFWLVVALTAVLIVQISYGGFVAGLKAGWVSNTWPLMFGRLVPEGALSFMEPWWENLFSAPITVHFIHRWFALAVLIMAGVLYWQVRKRPSAAAVQKAIYLFLILVTAQIALGVSVVWFSVPIVLALTHQAVALVMFMASIFILYQVSHQVAVARLTMPEAVAAAAR